MRAQQAERDRDFIECNTQAIVRVSSFIERVRPVDERASKSVQRVSHFIAHANRVIDRVNHTKTDIASSSLLQTLVEHPNRSSNASHGSTSMQFSCPPRCALVS